MEALPTEGITAALRHLAAESLPVYMALRAAPATSPQDRWVTVLEYSRRMSVILGRNDAPLDFRGENPQLADIADISHQIPVERACWELLEIMFVEQGRTYGSVVEDLVLWLQRNAAALSDGVLPPRSRFVYRHCVAAVFSALFAHIMREPSRNASRSETIAPVLERILPELQVAPKPDEVPGFWAAAEQLVAVGWFEAATDLLGLHSIWADWQLGRSAAAPAAEAMEAAIALMRTSPKLGGAKCLTLAAFEAYRQEWLLRCRETLAQESLWSSVSGTPTGEGVRSMLLIMAGDRSAVSAVTGGWIEQFVALLRHSYPTLRAPGDLHRIAEAALQQKGFSEEQRSPLDTLFLAALRRDAQAVLAVARVHLGSWFMAHAPELLAASGAEAHVSLKSQQSEAGGADQIEVYRVEYAMGLAQFPSTWHLAAKVLLTCPNVGRSSLRKLVAKLPTPATEREVRKVLHLLRSSGLHDDADRLCSAVGSARAAAGLPAAAALWFCEAEDEARLAELAEALLPERKWEAPKASDPRVELLLESVAEPFSTGPIASLRLFRELQQHIAAARRAPANGDRAAQEAAVEEEKKAAAALKGLLGPDVTPRDRWLAVLFAGIPLLEGVNGVLGSADTHWLLARLEELELQAWNGAGPLGAPGSPEEGLVEAVRLALARNLARAFIADADAPAGGGPAQSGGSAGGGGRAAQGW